MLVHKWVESYRRDPAKYAAAREHADSGFEFLDLGEAGDLPAPTLDMLEASDPPFERVAVQFQNSSADQTYSYLMTFEPHKEGGYTFFLAITYSPDIAWVTAGPYRLTKMTGAWRLEVSTEGNVLWVPDVSEGALLRSGMAAAALVWRAFAAMACSNVRTRDHQPDAALNKKRAKAGKVPLVSYKTLEIVVPNTRYEGGGSGGGTHASPRVHLRRGHIRKIADGKTVWVQACVVWSKHGMVLKDYKLRRAS